MKGDAFVLLISDGIGGFDQVEGQRETSFAINGEPVVTTSKDSGGWRALFATGGGNKQVTAQVSGYWSGGTFQKLLRTLAMSGDLEDFQIDDGTEVIEGGFQVTSFELTGPQGAEDQYSATLESGDQPTVT